MNRREIKKNMTGAAEQFEHHLEEFRKEVQGGIQFFYAGLAINGTAASNDYVLEALNEASLFWNTNIAALQLSYFVTLGRIFDQKSGYNIDRLIALAQNNIDLFSKRALAERKRNSSSNAHEWLDDYLKDAYEPTHDDFRCLRRYVRKYRGIYQANYDPIRDRIYAHKELATQSDKHDLFSKTKILEIEKLFVFLDHVYNILWQLYINGRAPAIRRIPFSITHMLRGPRRLGRSRTVQEDLTSETQKFLYGCCGP
jgi:hypothetical protein